MRAGQQCSPGVFFHRPVSTTVWITTSNLHSLAREESALATTLLPQHPRTRSLSIASFDSEGICPVLMSMPSSHTG